MSVVGPEGGAGHDARGIYRVVLRDLFRGPPDPASKLLLPVHGFVPAFPARRIHEKKVAFLPVMVFTILVVMICARPCSEKILAIHMKNPKLSRL
jgi:hypothetical protein